jgi:hypothetical protein
MPQYTNFLNLTLPELGEFIDSWDAPNNANFETLDDWTESLHDNLVAGTAGTGATWSGLRGSKDSLEERLAISVNADGTINISGSQDILDMSTSSYKGSFPGPADRINDADREIYEAGSPVADARFTPMVADGPSAGFPHAELDDGIAVRAADYGSLLAEAPFGAYAPWAPGLVAGGGDPIITGGGSPALLLLNVPSNPAVFNIDGYIFRLRDTVLFDYSLISPSTGDYVWIYVERKEANYGDSNFKYSESGGSPIAKDLRKLKSGSDGTTSTSLFTVVAGTLNSTPFPAKEGDTLRITSGGAAGDYVIDSVLTDLSLNIKGIFKANVGPAVPYEIIDNAMPNIGAVVSAGTPSDPTSPPPLAEGRVYIGRVLTPASGSPLTLVSFTRCGVYDSGWLDISDISTDFPLSEAHNLGAPPTSVDLWVREDATSRAFRPLVRRQIVADVIDSDTSLDPTDVKRTNFLVPSLYSHSSEVETTVVALNASPDVSGETVAALFTDVGGTDQLTGQIRIIVKR